MKARFETMNSRQLELNITFEDFLCSGVMRRQALQSMCEPEQVICDYLSPSADLNDPMELRETFAQACELATDHELSDIRFDTSDVLFIRRHILGGQYDPPPANMRMNQWAIAA